MKNVYYWLTSLFQVFEFNALIKERLFSIEKKVNRIDSSYMYYLFAKAAFQKTGHGNGFIM